MDRITTKHLEAMVDRLNRITNSPETPYTKNAAGKLVANVGNYNLSLAYGGVELQRMRSEGGGVQTPLHTGHTTKRRLYDVMGAYIRGIEEAKG